MLKQNWAPALKGGVRNEKDKKYYFIRFVLFSYSQGSDCLQNSSRHSGEYNKN